MALFEVDIIDPYEHDRMKQYAEFVSCISTGRYLVTVRSIHQEPNCSHRPRPHAGREEELLPPLKCRVMPNGVHVHLYSSKNEELFLRFVEVSDPENEALFDAFY